MLLRSGAFLVTEYNKVLSGYELIAQENFIEQKCYSFQHIVVN
jgi:hypothetical protein